MEKTEAKPEHVSLKQLTLRVCMLLALVSGQRRHPFHYLKVEDITLKESKCTILYLDPPPPPHPHPKKKTQKHTHTQQQHKQSWPGLHVEPAERLVIEQNCRLCSVKC